MFNSFATATAILTPIHHQYSLALCNYLYFTKQIIRFSVFSSSFDLPHLLTYSQQGRHESQHQDLIPRLVSEQVDSLYTAQLKAAHIT